MRVKSFWSMTFIQPLSALSAPPDGPERLDRLRRSAPAYPDRSRHQQWNNSVQSAAGRHGRCQVVNASVGFFGVVDASGITGITILNPASVPGRDGVAFDDFIAVTAVPEPQTWMTMLSALGLLGIRLKRRAAQLIVSVLTT